MMSYSWILCKKKYMHQTTERDPRADNTNFGNTSVSFEYYHSENFRTILTDYNHRSLGDSIQKNCKGRIIPNIQTGKDLHSNLAMDTMMRRRSQRIMEINKRKIEWESYKWMKHQKYYQEHVPVKRPLKDPRMPKKLNNSFGLETDNISSGHATFCYENSEKGVKLGKERPIIFQKDVLEGNASNKTDFNLDSNHTSISSNDMKDTSYEALKCYVSLESPKIIDQFVSITEIKSNKINLVNNDVMGSSGMTDKCPVRVDSYNKLEKTPSNCERHVGVISKGHKVEKKIESSSLIEPKKDVIKLSTNNHSGSLKDKKLSMKKLLGKNNVTTDKNIFESNSAGSEKNKSNITSSIQELPSSKTEHIEVNHELTSFKNVTLMKTNLNEIVNECGVNDVINKKINIGCKEYKVNRKKKSSNYRKNHNKITSDIHQNSVTDKITNLDHTHNKIEINSGELRSEKCRNGVTHKKRKLDNCSRHEDCHRSKIKPPDHHYKRKDYNCSRDEDCQRSKNMPDHHKKRKHNNFADCHSNKNKPDHNCKRKLDNCVKNDNSHHCSSHDNLKKSVHDHETIKISETDSKGKLHSMNISIGSNKVDTNVLKHSESNITDVISNSSTNDCELKTNSNEKEKSIDNIEYILACLQGDIIDNDLLEKNYTAELSDFPQKSLKSVDTNNTINNNAIQTGEIIMDDKLTKTDYTVGKISDYPPKSSDNLDITNSKTTENPSIDLPKNTTSVEVNSHQNDLDNVESPACNIKVADKLKNKKELLPIIDLTDCLPQEQIFDLTSEDDFNTNFNSIRKLMNINKHEMKSDDEDDIIIIKEIRSKTKNFKESSQVESFLKKCYNDFADVYAFFCIAKCFFNRCKEIVFKNGVKSDLMVVLKQDIPEQVRCNVTKGTHIINKIKVSSELDEWNAESLIEYVIKPIYTVIASKKPSVTFHYFKEFVFKFTSAESRNALIESFNISDCSFHEYCNRDNKIYTEEKNNHCSADEHLLPTQSNIIGLVNGVPSDRLMPFQSTHHLISDRPKNCDVLPSTFCAKKISQPCSNTIKALPTSHPLWVPQQQLIQMEPGVTGMKESSQMEPPLPQIVPPQCLQTVSHFQKLLPESDLGRIQKNPQQSRVGPNQFIKKPVTSFPSYFSEENVMAENSINNYPPQCIDNISVETQHPQLISSYIPSFQTPLNLSADAHLTSFRHPPQTYSSANAPSIYLSMMNAQNHATTYAVPNERICGSEKPTNCFPSSSSRTHYVTDYSETSELLPETSTCRYLSSHLDDRHDKTVYFPYLKDNRNSICPQPNESGEQNNNLQHMGNKNCNHPHSHASGEQFTCLPRQYDPDHQHGSTIQGGLNGQRRENNRETKEQVEKDDFPCDVCGNPASFMCAKCCCTAYRSEVCGNKDWNHEHSQICQILQESVRKHAQKI